MSDNLNGRVGEVGQHRSLDIAACLERANRRAERLANLCLVMRLTLGCNIKRCAITFKTEEGAEEFMQLLRKWDQQHNDIVEDT